MATLKKKNSKKKPQERTRIIVTSEFIKQLKGTAELSYIISQASLKDDFCNYSFVVKAGIGNNDEHAVTGSKMVTDDLIQAFGKLNVHLACIDDVFKHKGIEIGNIDDFHADETSSLYSVTGIMIKGSDENESVVLIGNKYVSCSGSRIDLKSPKIPLDNLSSYKWYNELRDAVENVRKEVSMYKEGKYVDYEAEEDNSAHQLSIGDGKDFDSLPSKANKVNWDNEDAAPNLEEEFNSAKQ